MNRNWIGGCVVICGGVVGSAFARRFVDRVRMPVSSPTPIAAEVAPVTRVLRIVDGDGAPAPGVLVLAEGLEKPKWTDARGEVPLPPVAETAKAWFSDRDGQQSVELTGPVTVARFRGAATLDVEVVDGSTGERIRNCGWRVRSDCGEWSPRGIAPRLAGYGDVEISVDSPAGFGAFDPFTSYVRVARRSTRARLTVPIYPVRELPIVCVEDQGRPVAGASAIESRVGAYGGDAVTSGGGKSGADGRLVLIAPRIPSGVLRVVLSRDCGDSTGARFVGSVVLRLDTPDAADAVTVLMARVPKEQETVQATGVGCRGVEVPPPPPVATAPLVVRVLDHEGRPAANVDVRALARWDAATTDEEGIARFDAVPLGRCDVVASTHGFLPTAVVADVGRDEQVVIREQAPRSVRVEVVDVDGVPQPAACVTVKCRAFRADGDITRWPADPTTVAQLDGDVETLTPTTGPDGVVVVTGPSVGTATYVATRGGLIGADSSAGDAVRIVVKSIQ